MEDNKDFKKHKSLATGPGAKKSTSSKSDKGFSVVYLVLVAVLSLMLGAILG